MSAAVKAAARTGGVSGLAGASTIIATSAAMLAVLAAARRAAARSQPVLVLGETGVGKDLLAEAIHQWSPRGDKPFVAVDCGMHRGELLSNQLFGHDPGAFTGATGGMDGLISKANGGTLFLDEVPALGLDDQARLLRLLERGEYRRVGGTRELHSGFRLVAAANGQLKDNLATGLFRSDLYHRLAYHVIRIPPLRERREDLLPLATAFIGRSGREIATGVEGVLLGYQWPGNVRELLAVAERVACDTEGRAPGPEAWYASIRAGALLGPSSGVAPDLGSELMLAVCARHRWQINDAARELGVHRATLYRRLAGLGYTPSRLKGLRRQATDRLMGA